MTKAFQATPVIPSGECAEKTAVILSEGEPSNVDRGLRPPEPKSKDLAVFPKNADRNSESPLPGERLFTPASRPKDSAIQKVARKLNQRNADAKKAIPRIDSFLEFLTHHARVKSGPGYVPYHFRGREALLPIVQQLDALLSSGKPDASLALCGGAQFGKTVLMLNLLAYLVAVRFRNVGYYLPDDDLVSGIVDGKLRPDVLDQVPWLARLLQVGKTLSPTGRAVNRKGAFLCTDGTRSALAFMRGLGKIPTSFSMDVVIQDEKDDLPEEHARFLSGRMTASDLRLSLIIGTQRYHGAGQNLAFTEGTQHIGLLRCPGCDARVNPETSWPGVCRLRMKDNGVVGESGHSQTEFGNEEELANAPRLTKEGHFISDPSIEMPAASASSRRPLDAGTPTETKKQNPVILSGGEPNNIDPGLRPPEPQSKDLAVFPTNSNQPFAFHHPIPYSPGQDYYLACPDCGAELNRSHPEWHALVPDRAALRRWSYRLSQLLFPDIDLAQIVAAWQLAIRDPAQMNVFCTDRLALPKSSSQTLTPHDLAAARENYHLGAAFPQDGRASEVAADVLIGGATNGSGMQSIEEKDGHPTNRAATSGQVASTEISRPAICTQREEDEVLRLRLGKVQASNNSDRLASAQDDSISNRFSVPYAGISERASIQDAGTLAANPAPTSDRSSFVSYGGLDLGDQCWFVARAVDLAAPHCARLLWIEPIAAERVRTRVPELFRALQLRALCVDAGPLRDLSRDLAFALNRLDEDSSATGDDASRNIFFSRNGATLPLRWLASAERWENLRCVPVEFTQREGAGVRHKVARTQEGRVYPLLAAHRDETIARVITELTSNDATGPARSAGMLIDHADGLAMHAAGPRFLLPTATDATRGVLDMYERHLLAGSRQERSADGRTLRFLDQCENHFLLATAYAALAELIAPLRDPAEDAPFRPVFRPLGVMGSRLRARGVRSVTG